MTTLRRAPLLILLALMVSAMGMAAPVAPSWLDSSFGDQGVSIVQARPPDLPPSPVTGYSSLTTRDGGVAVVGHVDRTLTIVKLTNRGKVETTFGDAGRVSFPDVTIWYEGGFCFAEQPDGKLIAGLDTYFDKAGEFLLVRLNSDGTRDESFGLHGVAFPPFPDRFFSRKLIVLPDGKLLLGATSSGDVLRVVRLNSNGDLDTTFGTQGYALGPIKIQNNHAGQVPDMWRQADGKILINSISMMSDGEKWSITRFLPSGALDTDFGVGGYIHTPTTSLNGYLSDFVLLPNGRILQPGPNGRTSSLFDSAGSLIGSSRMPNSFRYALLTNGSVVTLEGIIFDPVLSRSVVSVPGPIFYYRRSVTSDGAGGFYATGTGNSYRDPILLVARFTSSGALEPSFGTSGASSNFYFDVANTSAVQAVRLQSGGILVANQPTLGESIDTFGTGKSGLYVLDNAGKPLRASKLPDTDLTLNLSYLGSPSGTGTDGFGRYIELSGFVFGPVKRYPSTFVPHCLKLEEANLFYLGGGSETIRSTEIAAVRRVADNVPATTQNKLLIFSPPYTTTQTMVKDRSGGWYAVVLTSDGRYAIAHVLPGLVWDKTFGTNGYLAITGDCSLLVGSQCVSVLGDGTLAVATSESNQIAGFNHQNGVPLHQLRLFTAKGRLIKTIALPDFEAGMVQLLSGPEGGLMIAGPSRAGFTVRRLTPQYTLDVGFGGEVANGYDHADSVWGFNRSVSGEVFICGGTRAVNVTYPFVAKIKSEQLTVGLYYPGVKLLLNRRTGLLSDFVRVDNHGASTSPAMKLRIANLPPGVSIWKGIKEGKQASWLIPVPPIAAGDHSDVTLEYYVPSHKDLVIMPTLELVNDSK